ncbi:MAG: XRE family transcriptional regulator [Ruminococcaceae bacterium]|nr:XRE family transcriptional regulator [Oscillospiraceae bacterium]
MLSLTLLGENIRKLRTSRKLSQAQLSAKLLVSFQAISNWERGVAPPDLDNLCKLAELFGVSVDSLLGIGNDGRERLLLGIDGGGTKTEFVLFTETGRVKKRRLLPQSNPSTVGFDGCFAILSEGIDAMLDDSPEIQGIFAGMAGALTMSNADRMQSFLKQHYRNIRTTVQSDALNVLYSAKNPGDDSMGLICGTGSVLMVHKNGQNFRFGGWGSLFADMGSAYEIARGGIVACLRAMDGLSEETVLSRLLPEAAGASDMSALPAICYERGKSFIASLAPQVFRAYADGDRTAETILRENAAGLAKLIDAARGRHGDFREIIACGGIFEHHRTAFEPMIAQHLTSPLAFVYPELPPVYGACVGCCHALDIPTDDAFFRNFSESFRQLTEQTN